MKYRITSLILTARDTGDRLAECKHLLLKESGSGVTDAIIDPSRKRQIVNGFGGAFTEAAATTLYKLSEERRKEVLKAYFDSGSGHGYALCRTHINSCDFSLGNYAYAETPGDTALKSFSIERDRQALIPMIHEATSVADRDLTIF
ncbi:MAG: glucosylceramidase, partial [Verrucomicrobia bacterium]|nr:glucosylceramidase [Verrucomicrobiota bacterium]